MGELAGGVNLFTTYSFLNVQVVDLTLVTKVCEMSRVFGGTMLNFSSEI